MQLFLFEFLGLLYCHWYVSKLFQWMVVFNFLLLLLFLLFDMIFFLRVVLWIRFFEWIDQISSLLSVFRIISSHKLNICWHKTKTIHLPQCNFCNLFLSSNFQSFSWRYPRVLTLDFRSVSLLLHYLHFFGVWICCKNKNLYEDWGN